MIQKIIAKLRELAARPRDPSALEDAEFTMNEWANVACFRYQDCGPDSAEFLEAHEAWRRAWLTWAELLDLTIDNPTETT